MNRMMLIESIEFVIVVAYYFQLSIVDELSISFCYVLGTPRYRMSDLVRYRLR